jgi:myo-inositol-1(or 4)-monophosphatase
MQIETWQILAESVRDLTIPIFVQAGYGAQQSEQKADGSLLTQTDMQLNETLTQFLNSFDHNTPVLSEEMPESEQIALLSTGNCWLLDPLDGTSNFSHGIPVYSVSLALMREGHIIAGMVFDPNRNELFTAVKGHGAYLNRIAIEQRTLALPSSIKKAMAMIDTKRLEPDLAIAIVTQHPYHSQRSFGSVALDWCWLAMGRIHTYLHGKQKLWDFAAGALIAQEAGALTHTLDQQDILLSPLQLESRSAVGACWTLQEAWQTWIQQHRKMD